MRQKSFLDRLAESQVRLDLILVGVGIAVGLIFFLPRVLEIVGASSSFIIAGAWAVLATLAVPIAIKVAYGMGQRDGKEKHYQRGYDAGWATGMGESRRRIAHLEETGHELGDTYLKGAERGLGMAEKMVNTKAKVMAVLPQPTYAPQLPQSTWELLDHEGEVIDV